MELRIIVGLLILATVVLVGAGIGWRVIRKRRWDKRQRRRAWSNYRN